MADRLEITRDLCESIKTMAYFGLTQEDIAQKLNRGRDTLFYRGGDKENPILKAYYDGKKAHKDKLLKDIDEIGNNEKDKRLQFDIKKYQLNVLHKTREVSKSEVEQEVKGNVSININYPNGFEET